MVVVIVPCTYLFWNKFLKMSVIKPRHVTRTGYNVQVSKDFRLQVLDPEQSWGIKDRNKSIPLNSAY